jgi:predicted DNA-binding transcriptional regulator AlpA
MTRNNVTTPADGRTTVPTLLTARQVYKDILGIDKRSFYQELAAGRIPKPVRIGASRTRWRADRLNAWLDSLESTPDQAA